MAALRAMDPSDDPSASAFEILLAFALGSSLDP